MTITAAQLIAAGVQPTQAKQFADPLSAACALYEINTKARIAAFVSQCAHESAGFTRFEENLYYSTPERIRAIWPTRVSSLADAATLCRNPSALANRVYANRMGNGNSESFDGWRFRGRGLFQLTGRNNYHDASVELNRPYVVKPELVAEPSDACLTAAWFWHVNKLNNLADASNVDAVTRVINGPAMAGLSDRKQLFERAVQAFA